MGSLTYFSKSTSSLANPILKIDGFLETQEPMPTRPLLQNAAAITPSHMYIIITMAPIFGLV